MQQRGLLVTHHAPDLDAIASVWMLKRFDAQHYATARVAFVNPGETITLEEAEEYGCQLHQVTHVDTGLGEFDHHQPDRGQQFICATSLVYNHVCKIHPELANDEALKFISEFSTEIDHFHEIYWPDSDNPRYEFMIHEIIRGLESVDQHDDDSMLHFGMTCLDSVYASLTLRLKAEQIINESGITFEISHGQCLGIETSNGDTEKLAQKQGKVLIVRKDTKLGSIRVKCRPDAKFDLRALYEKIIKKDSKGTWYYHPGGKMLLNGSSKHRDQTPSPLSVVQVIELVKELYG